MFKKILAILLILGLVLPVGMVMASSAPARGGKPTATPIPPTEPPVPTETPDTGSLYGDLYVILRDENGLPIYDAHGCIQPISSTSGFVSIDTSDGTLTIVAVAGEPFSLATYTDTAGDLVECELTEEMATWVQAVDFGRLNLGRAPDSVINHALDEAINKMNLATDFDLDPAGRLMMLIGGEWFTIDAPAENLALYIKMMTDGHWITIDTTSDGNGGKGGGNRPPGDGPSTEPRPVLSADAIVLLGQIGYSNLGNLNNVLNNHDLLLAASLLAAASDKTGTMPLDKVIYINSIYGINQLGTLTDEKGNKYFNFSVRDNGAPYSQDRAGTYSTRRSGETCNQGWIWVLQPEAGVANHYVTDCIEILAYENSNHNGLVAGVHFTDMKEVYDTVDPDYPEYLYNARGFAQSADDALQVLEYIHNYKVPEVLYVP